MIGIKMPDFEIEESKMSRISINDDFESLNEAVHSLHLSNDSQLIEERFQEYDDIDSFEQMHASDLTMTRDANCRPIHIIAPTVSMTDPLSVGAHDRVLNSKNVHSSSHSIATTTEGIHESSKEVNCELCPHFPLKPTVLLPTHFTVALLSHETLEESRVAIVKKINNFLNNVKGFDFHYFETQNTWCGKHICSSSYSEVQIQLYEEENEVIVEVVKYYGDSKPFFHFYRQFKTFLTDNDHHITTNSPCLSRCLTPIPTPLTTTTTTHTHTHTLLSDIPLSCTTIPHVDKDQFLRGIAPIFFMSTLPYLETRVEALKMIGEFATRLPYEYIQDNGCGKKCIDLLDQHILLHSSNTNTNNNESNESNESNENNNENEVYVKQLAIVVYASLVPILLHQMIQWSHAIPCFFHLLLSIDQQNAFNFESIQSLRDCATILVTMGQNDSEALYDRLIHTNGTNGNGSGNGEDMELMNHFLTMNTNNIADEYLRKEVEILINILQQKQNQYANTNSNSNSKGK